MRLLPLFPHINLKKAFRIVAYQWRDDIGGYVHVYGLPEGVPWPDSSECLKSKKFTPTNEYVYPFPTGAIDNLASLLELDGSPESYIEAALFLQEVNEIGAFWHGINWGNYHFVGDIETLRRHATPETNSTSKNTEECKLAIDGLLAEYDLPFDDYGDLDILAENDHPFETGDSLKEWKWLEPRDEDFSPRVILGQEKVEVIWHTFSGYHIERLDRWNFYFDATSRQFLERRVTSIAEGTSGYMY